MPSRNTCRSMRWGELHASPIVYLLTYLLTGEAWSSPQRILLHVFLDGILQRLRLGAADAVDLLRVLPEVKGRQRTHALATHELVRLRAAVTHDLEKRHILVLLAELIVLWRNDLARTAPRSRVVDDHERSTRPLESLVKLLLRGDLDHHSLRLPRTRGVAEAAHRARRRRHIEARRDGEGQHDAELPEHECRFRLC